MSEEKPVGILGIDLGTTNSCVAIRGIFPDCYESPDLTGFSIVTDRRKRKTTPSVVCATGKPEAPFEVGHTAKRKIDGDHPPVMFAKRHLGTDKTFALSKDITLTPEAVSAEILKYLKTMAETKLGGPMKRAVVTVPAYFSLNQKILTRNALEAAGFIIDDDGYIIQEPVAAGLSYVQMTKVDAMRIMVYDLGGGTFDITVLKKEGDMVDVVKFGGDHALGGYDFDRRLADVILKRLQDDGYALDLDTESRPEDRMRYTKLLLEAEQAKIELSRQEEHHLRRPAIFEDQEGEPVDLDFTLARTDFEAAVGDKVDYTMDLCKETLGRSGYTIDQIDKIIMVGGSSYIPLVQKKLAETFGKTPDLLEPDLCVAVGAAIHASQLGTVVEQTVNIKLNPVPATSILDEEAVSGAVTDPAGKPVPPGYVIEIADTAGGFTESQEIPENGAFFFDVPLRPDAENAFTLRVKNPGGDIDAETVIRIAQTDDAPDESAVGTTPGAVNLPKNIYLKRASGMEILAAEGVQLPFENTINAHVIKHADTSETGGMELEVELFEEDFPLGPVVVKDIPGSIHHNAAVEVGIKVAGDFTMIVNAYLPSVDRKGTSVYRLEKTAVTGANELRAELERLEAAWEERKMMLTQEELAKTAVKIKRGFARAREYLSGTEPDTTEASNVIRSLARMIDEIRVVEMDPPRNKFESLLTDAQQLVGAAEQVDPRFRDADHGKTLSVIARQAEEAYRRRDAQAWKAAYGQLEEIAAAAAQIIRQREGGGGRQEVDPRQLLMQITMMANELEAEIRKRQGHPKYTEWIKEIAAIKQECKEAAGLTDPADVKSAVFRIYQTRYQPLQEDMNIPEEDQPGLKLG